MILLSGRITSRRASGTIRTAFGGGAGAPACSGKTYRWHADRGPARSPRRAGRRAAALIGFALVTLAAAPAAAAAPTVTTDRACYAAESEQVVLLNGSGYTPLAPLTVTVTGRRGALSFQTTADASGALANVPLKVPTLTEPGFTDRRRPSATIAVTDTGVVPAVAATTQITVTTWGVEVVPWYRRVPVAHPRRAVR